MEIYELNSEEISIKVRSTGAELVSLKDEESGQEYMWSADPQFWPKTSPFLFPFIGRLKKQQYTYKGKTYHPAPHGFARDMEFEMVEKTQTGLWLAIRDTKDTKEVYPFFFYLEVGYILKNRTLKVEWKVKNTGEEKMYFSIGGHPGFACPMEQGEKRSNCAIWFEGKEEIISRGVSMEEGLVTDEYTRIPLQEGKLPIADDLFKSDALVLENHQIQKLALLNKKGHPYVTFTMDAPVYGIWSSVKPGAPFICFEPWYGRCDAVDFTGQLEERQWQQELEIGQEFETYYCIEI